jgi:hypothetical protein
MVTENPLPETIPCRQCLKEIPPSQAITREGDDYVLYFCGAECHARWEREQAEETERAFGERSGVKDGG